MSPPSLLCAVLCGIFAPLPVSLVLCAIVLLLALPLLLLAVLLFFFYQISGSLVPLLRFLLHPVIDWWCLPVFFFACLFVFFWEFSAFDHFIKFCSPQRCYCPNYFCSYVFVIVHLFFPSVLWFFLRLFIVVFIVFVVVFIPTWYYMYNWRLAVIVHFFLGPVLRCWCVCLEWCLESGTPAGRREVFLFPSMEGNCRIYCIRRYLVTVQPLDGGEFYLFGSKLFKINFSKLPLRQ